MTEPREEAVLYLRLSSADGADCESNSIQNQRAFLHRWAEEQGFGIKEEYVDDGCTGTDFERSGFQRLNEGIMAGEIHCVIVKDLSRLGRNYAETGRYLEQIFPRMGVRFIAINDGYDSARNTESSQQMAVLRNVFNDFYAADCSVKVRTSLRILKKQGKYLGGKAPYGYTIDPADKYHLIPDTGTGPVVQQIYRHFLAGESRTQIAEMLELQGVQPPAQEKKICIERRNPTGKWSTATLKRILSARVYVGDMEQQLTRTVSYKVHERKRTAQEEHILVENTHEPLISREDYALAQQMLLSGRYQTAGKEHLLTGKVFCADCGAPMYAKRRGNYWYLICHRYYKEPTNRLCTSHSIREDQVVDAVRNALRKETEKLTALTLEERTGTVHGNAEERKRTQYRLELVKKAKQNVYLDNSAGKLNEGEFRELMDGLRQEEERLIKAVEALTNADILSRKNAECFLAFSGLTKSQLGILIDRIEIGEGKRVTIRFAFRQPIE